MELLAEIARDDDIKTYFSEDQEQSPSQPRVKFNSPDLKTLHERLLKEAVSSKGVPAMSQDIFVEDHEVVDRTCLRMDKLPAFLCRYADTILRTGKYLNVIQQCDEDSSLA